MLFSCYNAKNFENAVQRGKRKTVGAFCAAEYFDLMTVWSVKKSRNHA